MLLLLLLLACTTPERTLAPDLDLSDLPSHFTDPGAGEVLDVWFTQPGVVPAEVTENEVDDALIALIDAATTRIDMSLYEFNFQPVIDAVIAAHDRGVTLRFVGDGDEEEDPGYVALVDAGLTLSMRNPRDRIMHNKFLVIDDQAVWTGSMNISENGLYRNNNHGMVIQSADLAAWYTDEFEQMWAGTYGRNKEDLTGGIHDVEFRDAPVEFWFSPSHEPMFRLVDLVDTADHSLHFMVFAYTHPDLLAAMVAAKDRGVDVAGIFDESQGRGYYSIDEALAQAGVPTFVDGNGNASGFSGGKMHHKVMIGDAGTDSDPFVISGSFNWSKSANLYNDENFVVIRDPALVSLFHEEYCDRVEEAWLHEEYVGELPPACTSPSREVFINEFLPNPTGTDRGNEYVEIVNGSSSAVDITGWTLGDLANGTRHVFEGILAAGDAVALYDSGDYDLVSTTGSLSLNNTGDTLTLTDSSGLIVSQVEYGTSKEGISWNRSPDASGESGWDYHDEVDGSTTDHSPGTRADGSVFVEPPSAHVIVNEVFPNPSGTDLGSEYVELVNVGDATATLSGWYLADLNRVRHEFTDEVLEPGDFLLIYDRGKHSGDGVIVSSSGQLSLNNTGDTVTLYDGDGSVHDLVSWSTGNDGISLNRAEDGVAGTALVDHDLISALNSSPATRVDGSAW